MSEKPIIFSTDMVRAILDGRKTVTRRVIKPQPYLVDSTLGVKRWAHDKLKGSDDPLCLWDEEDIKMELYESDTVTCPYGYAYYNAPADELWVRETWATAAAFNHMKPSDIPQGQHIWYGVNDNSDFVVSAGHWRGKRRPSIFMPRWASRIQLRVTDVRVERVQEITEKQAIKEGMELVPVGTATWSNRQSFSILWDKINAKRGYSWGSNPFVWVVEFEVIKP